MRKLILAALVLVAQPLSGQRVLDDAWYDLKHGALDIGYIWTFPLHAKTRDLPAIGALAGATALTLVYDDEIQAWLRNNPNSLPVDLVEPFRMGHEAVRLGDIWTFIRYSGALWVVGVVADSRTLREGGMGCVSAGVAQTLARRTVLYNLVKRTRPDSAKGPYEFDVPGSKIWKYRSFYGGHAANAMTCISFLNSRFDLSLLEPVLYATAIGVGVGRIVDGAHWSSDTLVGLVAGYAAGRTVALRMKSRARARAAAAPESRNGDDSGLVIDYVDNRVIVGWQLKH